MYFILKFPLYSYIPCCICCIAGINKYSATQSDITTKFLRKFTGEHPIFPLIVTRFEMNSSIFSSVFCSYISCSALPMKSVSFKSWTIFHNKIGSWKARIITIQIIKRAIYADTIAKIMGKLSF